MMHYIPITGQGWIFFMKMKKKARNGVINSLNFLNTLNTENPNSMIMQFFFQGKSAELVKVFSRANGDLKTRASDILTKIGYYKCSGI